MLVSDLRPDSTPEDHKILPHIWERKYGLRTYTQSKYFSNIRETDIFNMKKNQEI